MVTGLKLAAILRDPDLTRLKPLRDLIAMRSRTPRIELLHDVGRGGAYMRTASQPANVDMTIGPSPFKIPRCFSGDEQVKMQTVASRVTLEDYHVGKTAAPATTN